MKAFDTRSARPKLLFEALKASVEVINPVHCGFAARHKPGYDEGNRSAKIGSHDFGAPERLSAADLGHIALHRDVSPEPRQFLHMHKPVFEDGFANVRFALGAAHHGHKLGLEIGRKAGE